MKERVDGCAKTTVSGSRIGHWKGPSSLKLGEAETPYCSDGAMFLRELEGKGRKGLSLEKRVENQMSLGPVRGRRALRLRGGLCHCLLQLLSRCQSWDTPS